ncbi:Glutamate-rich protein 3-like isoform X3 [Oopsacas minuta]|uniref:Glutamate-rich protein 3-like isoform X3 n=1 Tax=Oopsacas minuta TaxID=111878 RepID=A0AAV7JZH6_9METZ|nr:Glutamate-rich protein 3-like isoform X3 [Oopsacas minuta]
MAARADMSYLATYNSLLDEHLGQYLSRPAVRRHLRRQGLIKGGGEVVGEEEWRAVVHRREVKEKMDRDKFQQQRRRVREEDVVRRGAEHRHRQLLQSNYALADRIRLQAERHHPAYVRERNFTPLSRADSNALGIKSTPVVPDRDLITPSTATTKSSQSIGSSSLRSLYRNSPYVPKPPSKNAHPSYKSSGKTELRNTQYHVTNMHRRNVIKPVYGGTPLVQSKATITLLYKGRGIKLNGKTIQETQSDVSVYQQHCGGNAVLVYHGYLSPGSRFSFISRRHMDSTLGLTFYLSGLVDARLSACCEYRYKPGHRVGGGGKTCHYEWVSVKDATPCFKCQAEIETDKFIVAEKSSINNSHKNSHIKEAWVNTSILSVNKEVSYFSSEFDEVSSSAGEDNEVVKTAIKLEDTEALNAASIPEGIVPAYPQVEENLEVPEMVSRRSSLSSDSDGTSSVSLDSDLDESQSESEIRPDSAVSNTVSSTSQSSYTAMSRDYSSSLGHVTPDDRLLVPSALTAVSPAFSEALVENIIAEQQLAITEVEDINIPTHNVGTSIHGVDSVTDNLDNSPQNSVFLSSPEVDNTAVELNTSVHTSADVTSSPLSMVTNNDTNNCITPYIISGTSLHITRNLTHTQIEELVQLIQDNTIHSLILENTRNFTPNHLDTLFTHMVAINKIQITHSELTKDHLNIILEYLQQTETLEISHSVISPDHFIVFMNNLAVAAPKLAEFNTSYCDIRLESPITNVLNSLVHLTSVNLSGNVLKNAIRFDSLHTPNLKELHLDNTELQEPELLELFNFLFSNAAIHTLSLKGNYLSKQVLQRLLDLLQENRNIKQLFFTPSNTDDSQIQHINVKLITDILDKRAI